MIDRAGLSRWLIACASSAAVGLVAQPARADGCAWWKDLLCSPVITTCAPASFGGAGPYINCVDKLSNHWCDECIDAGVNPQGNTGEPKACYVASMCQNLSAAQTVFVAWGARDVAPNGDGHLEVIAPDYWGNLVHVWQNTPSGSWSGFASYGATAASVPSAVQRNGGVVDVFFVGGDGAIWHVYQVVPNANWYPPTSIGGSFAEGGVASDLNTDGRIQLAAIDGEGILWLITETDTGSGQYAFTEIGGSFSGTPAFGANADGRLELIALGADGRLWHSWQYAPSGSWSGFVPYGPQTFQGKPAVGRNTDGRLEVFATGTDLALWHVWQTTPNAGWSSWYSFGGTHKYDPAISVDADGRLEAYVVGINDSAVWRVRQNTPGGAWDNWQSLGGVVVSGPEAARNTDGTIDVFALGQNYGVWHNRQTAPNSDYWTGWYYLGGTMNPATF